MSTVGMSDGQLLAYLGTDASRWAEVFIERVREHPDMPSDEGSMLGWFANALEAGRDEGRKELCPHPTEHWFAAGDLRLCAQCGKDLFR